MDVTEAQTVMILVHLISAIYTPSVWLIDVLGTTNLGLKLTLGNIVVFIWFDFPDA